MNPWHYAPARDLDKPLIERLRRFPREPDMLVYGIRLAAALAIRAWLRVYHRFTVAGREHLPKGESFVLVANHSSHLDALCLLSALPLAKLHRAYPAAAQDYFFVPMRRLLVAAVIVNALPFDRRNNVGRSIDLCRDLLDRPGNALLLFPEGTRSVDGAIGEFKPGVGLVMAGLPYPVIPCYLGGAAAAWPKGCWLPRPRRVEVIIGCPRSYAHLQPGMDTAHLISNELRQDVLALAAAKHAAPLSPESQEASE